MLDYARNFGNAATEGIKRTTHWAAIYFSWYPVSERAETLPSYPYQREVRPGESVSLERFGEQRRNEAEEAGEEDGILEYDSSSKIWMTSLLVTKRPTMMLVEFCRWIARPLFCLERFLVSEELFASIAEL